MDDVVEDLHALDPRVGEHAHLQAPIELLDALGAIPPRRSAAFRFGCTPARATNTAASSPPAHRPRLELAREDVAERRPRTWRARRPHHAEACEQ